MDEWSYYIMQLGPPNPLEECTSQLLDTKVASQRCHMELIDLKFMKSTGLGEYNLVHSIKTVVYSKRYLA